MQCSHPIASWAEIAVFSTGVSGIDIGFLSAGLMMSMEFGILPSVGCVTIVAGWVPLILLSSVLFILSNYLLIRLSFYCSGSVDPLSPSLEYWFMMVVVGVEVVVNSLLSCIDLGGVLVVCCYWRVKSWWNGSGSLGVEFSFDPRFTISK